MKSPNFTLIRSLLVFFRLFYAQVTYTPEKDGVTGPSAVGLDIEIYIVVPSSSIDCMWIPEEPTDNIHFISIAKTFDYTDAIMLANRIAGLPGMTPKGGARNVVQRDGIGTVMLDGAVAVGQIPDHYFQAIGNGTGGIIYKLHNTSHAGISKISIPFTSHTSALSLVMTIPECIC